MESRQELEHMLMMVSDMMEALHLHRGHFSKPIDVEAIVRLKDAFSKPELLKNVPSVEELELLNLSERDKQLMARIDRLEKDMQVFEIAINQQLKEVDQGERTHSSTRQNIRQARHRTDMRSTGDGRWLAL